MGFVLFFFAAAVFSAMLTYHTRKDLKEYAAYMSNKGKKSTKAFIWFFDGLALLCFIAALFFLIFK